MLCAVWFLCNHNKSCTVILIPLAVSCWVTLSHLLIYLLCYQIYQSQDGCIFFVFYWCVHILTFIPLVACCWEMDLSSCGSKKLPRRICDLLWALGISQWCWWTYQSSEVWCQHFRAGWCLDYPESRAPSKRL